MLDSMMDPITHLLLRELRLLMLMLLLLLLLLLLLKLLLLALLLLLLLLVVVVVVVLLVAVVPLLRNLAAFVLSPASHRPPARCSTPTASASLSTRQT